MPHTIITLYHQELIFDNFSVIFSANVLHLLRLAYCEIFDVFRNRFNTSRLQLVSPDELGLAFTLVISKKTLNTAAWPRGLFSNDLHRRLVLTASATAGPSVRRDF